MEKNVISDNPNPEDTYLGTNNKDEIELFRLANQIQEEQKQRALELQEKMKTDPSSNYDAEMKSILELSDNDKAIVKQADLIYTQRVMHLFDNAVAQHAHLNDPMCKYIFYERFYWFLSEMKDWLYHVWKESEISNEPGFSDLCAGEQEQKLKPIYDTWRKDWLSAESFTRYMEKSHAFKTHEEIEKMVANRTPEQIAQDEIEEKAEEEEEAKWNAQDAKYLKEKCPTCLSKCKWYNEQARKAKPQEPTK
ncbi:MAG: hypothetical protein ABSB71_09950 [Candidatus Bathyarchaeia archaeon]